MRGTNTGTTDEFVTISGFGLESLTRESGARGVLRVWICTASLQELLSANKHLPTHQAAGESPSKHRIVTLMWQSSLFCNSFIFLENLKTEINWSDNWTFGIFPRSKINQCALHEILSFTKLCLKHWTYFSGHCYWKICHKTTCNTVYWPAWPSPINHFGHSGWQDQIFVWVKSTLRESRLAADWMPVKLSAPIGRSASSAGHKPETHRGRRRQQHPRLAAV